MNERLEIIKSPRFFRHMQYLQFFIHYHRDHCTRYSPGGLASPIKKEIVMNSISYEFRCHLVGNKV
jgi:hypothetical protein